MKLFFIVGFFFFADSKNIFMNKLDNCPSHCFLGHCSNGLCYSCDGNLWGPTCDNLCSSHCFFSCDMETGCCGSCSDSYVGDCTCSISSQCAYPEGINCDWYSTCLNTDAKNCPIIDDIMNAKCKEYANLELSLSPIGLEWSQYVRSCLQKVLANNVLITAPSGKVNCQTATDAFFKDHIGCYLNGPVSFCELSYKDIGMIVMHGASILFSKYWYDPLVTGTQLKYACDLEFWETILQGHSKNKIYKSLDFFCNNDNITTSLETSINAELAPLNWTITFVSAKNITNIDGTSILVLSSINNVQSPLNTTIATELVLNVMKDWQANNTQCNLMFNGNYIDLTRQKINIR
jgi:hypothetical protein